MRLRSCCEDYGFTVKPITIDLDIVEGVGMMSLAEEQHERARPSSSAAPRDMWDGSQQNQFMRTKTRER